MASKQGTQHGGKEGDPKKPQQEQGSGKQGEQQQGNQKQDEQRRGQSTAGNQDGTPGQQNSGRPGKGGS